MLINLSVLFDKPTGITTYATNLFPRLQSLNPTLLIAEPVPGYCCYEIPGNLSPASGSRGHLRRLGWTQFKLPQIYRQLKASLLFSPVPEAPLFQGCRSVVMVHDLIPLRFLELFNKSPLRYYFRYYIPQVLGQVEHIICNSEATAADIVDFWGISAKKITPIPLAYDSDHFRPLTLPLNEQPPYFLYIGRQDPYKNVRRLIAAFAKVRGECELWIAGTQDTRYTPSLEQQAKELGLGSRVKFLEYVPYEELPILLNRAIALVFPSLWEGFGIPVLEAMACGTPVVTSNCSSLPEVAGDAALLVNPYQVEEIAQAMQMLLENEGARSRLKQLSLQQAQQFSWDKTGEQTAKVLQQYL
ncbi:glycosyltransferase family 4 protein [Lusitaniella coriacea LEGE 07157]|uniref:Glycosyltransferase family 4 protein n=1 Tax=Lusitaniella coriacea LEGE 07157 TaxID=945747 RepID=A0A8J7DLC3_9CYAN|nr:glycosyltransferase family 1 protein [Lusitaniella coriacea]MBE9114743.1 glycosyltransferase family 4 protein [Lusitaniella coriacea LEGE 07157]